MANYDPCFKFVMYLEDSTLSGVVTNTAGDSGGMTRFGIAARFASGLPSDFYTTDRVSAFSGANVYYRRLYWNRICGDQISNDRLAAQFLSIAVNMGVERATKLMQEAACVYADGVCGPGTVAAINAKDSILLLSAFNQKTMTHYRAIADANPEDVRFLQGWLNRVTAIYQFPLIAA